MSDPRLRRFLKNLICLLVIRLQAFLIFWTKHMIQYAGVVIHPPADRGKSNPGRKHHGTPFPVKAKSCNTTACTQPIMFASWPEHDCCHRQQCAKQAPVDCEPVPGNAVRCFSKEIGIPHAGPAAESDHQGSDV